MLVHGGYHGAWCWDFLSPELVRLGHRVIAVDLPISDPTLGAADYARTVAEAIDPGSVPMIVGHSMAGVVIPFLPAIRPVQRLVFLAAFLPRPGHSVNDQRSTEAIDGRVALRTNEFTDLGDDVWMIGPNTATELFYHDAPASSARWAAQRLRPQAYRAMSEVTPLVEWPDVPCSFILCREDRALNPDWARNAARDRLGVTALELPGGHSPFLTRARDLAGLLDGLTRA